MAVKWGYLGTGRIIPRFMAGMIQVEEAVPSAIYGRNIKKAQKLADLYGFKQVFDRLDAFLEQADVDIVYNALSHPLHEEYTTRCLERKIPVLCEKPMAPTFIQEQRMVECARKNDTFLMEGMWTRMFPVTRQAMQWIAEGRIGEVVAMNSVFAIKAPPENITDRLFALSEGGGTLLDIGIYCVSFAHLLFGQPPLDIVSLANLSKLNGTDRTAGIVFRYDTGQMATILTTFLSEGKDIVTIYGSDGMIEIFEDFWRPRNMRLTYHDGIIDFTSPEVKDGSVYGSPVSFKGDGYQFEVRHVHDCLEKGLKESPLITHKQSLEIIATCDRIRKIWGVKFPFDEA